MGDPEITAQPSINEVQTDNGFVTLLDVLGFKRMPHERQQAVVETLEHVVAEVWPETSGLKHNRYSRWLKKPLIRMFSDTIVIAYPRTPNGPVAQDLFHFVNNTLGLLYCYLFKEGILLRGCVGYGSVWERRFGVYGTAIIDAQVEYEETSWAGVHYSNTATSFIAQWHDWAMKRGLRDARRLAGTEHNLNQTQFYVADVPFKESCKLPPHLPAELSKKRIVVPWPKEIRAVYDYPYILANDYKTSYVRIHEVLDAELQRCENVRVQEILTNTTNFADMYLSRFPDLNLPIELQGPLPRVE
jgi:hypothetical protein